MFHLKYFIIIIQCVCMMATEQTQACRLIFTLALYRTYTEYLSVIKLIKSINKSNYSLFTKLFVFGSL